MIQRFSNIFHYKGILFQTRQLKKKNNKIIVHILRKKLNWEIKKIVVIYLTNFHYGFMGSHWSDFKFCPQKFWFFKIHKRKIFRFAKIFLLYCLIICRVEKMPPDRATIKTLIRSNNKSLIRYSFIIVLFPFEYVWWL